MHCSDKTKSAHTSAAEGEISGDTFQGIKCSLRTLMHCSDKNKKHTPSVAEGEISGDIFQGIKCSLR